jgi:hypothetical protein
MSFRPDFVAALERFGHISLSARGAQRLAWHEFCNGRSPALQRKTRRAGATISTTRRGKLLNRTLVLAGISCDFGHDSPTEERDSAHGAPSPILSPPFPCGFDQDDLDKFKVTDFRSQELFNLIDSIYRNGQILTITRNFTLKEPGELEKVHPSFIRRIDEICKVTEF